MKAGVGIAALGVIALGSAAALTFERSRIPSGVTAEESGECGTAGLTLPAGFCATIFADNLGHARHMAVADDGTVYVNTWSGKYYANSPPPPGGFLVALRDTDGDGKADKVERFGPGAAQGNAGGTGIALYDGWIYAETNDKIVRYRLNKGTAIPDPTGETILTGMPLTGDHPMHPFKIDAQGNLFVNMGSATNTCEAQNRQPGSKGLEPCTEQETRAGIWRYDARKAGQVFSPAGRFATGIRNTGGISFDASGRMFASSGVRSSFR